MVFFIVFVVLSQKFGKDTKEFEKKYYLCRCLFDKETMEPPSSFNSRESVTDPLADDPLSQNLTIDSYRMYTRA